MSGTETEALLAPVEEHTVVAGSPDSVLPRPATQDSASKVEEQKTRPPRPRKPNYNLIHSAPLPLATYPLPAFHPSNPLSLLQLAYAFLSCLVSPPSSHLPSPYIGAFSHENRSIHVTDPVHARALWEMGFFGKGLLSRSEPSWLKREGERLRAERASAKGGGDAVGKPGTAEEATRKRRDERRMFKLERARVEKEKVERQRAIENGTLVVDEEEDSEVKDAEADTSEKEDSLQTKLSPETYDPLLEEAQAVGGATPTDAQDPHGNPVPITTDIADAHSVEHPAARATDVRLESTRQADASPISHELRVLNDEMPDEPLPHIEDQEYLQLTLEEAFFLSYGLGVLSITSPKSHSPSASNLLSLFAAHSTFPSRTVPSTLASTAPEPDDQFLLNYVTYHHFRSLGWVIRPGVKFAVDYLLYNRGPVFSHAEFAVIIIPAYTNSYWKTESGHSQRRFKEERDWWWLHCVNRVQSQVRKSLVVCYVDVPPPRSGAWDGDVGSLLKGYKIREFVIKRWLANRSRD